MKVVDLLQNDFAKNFTYIMIEEHKNERREFDMQDKYLRHFLSDAFIQLKVKDMYADGGTVCVQMKFHRDAWKRWEYCQNYKKGLNINGR